MNTCVFPGFHIFATQIIKEFLQKKQRKEERIMDAKTTGIVAYLTWIGLLIAISLGDREGAKFHVNQALVIWLFGLLSAIPCVGWLWGIF